MSKIGNHVVGLQEQRNALREALDNTLWMAREWYEHIGYANMNSEEHKAAIAEAETALADAGETP